MQIDGIFIGSLLGPTKSEFYSSLIENKIFNIINIYIYIYIHVHFANGLGDLGSIPGRVIPKTQKMVLDATLLNTQHYNIRIKVKWSNPGKGVIVALLIDYSCYPRLRSPTLLTYVDDIFIATQSFNEIKKLKQILY